MNRKSHTRFSKLNQFYEAIHNLTGWLRSEGHAEDAQKLDSVMHTACTTSSELLGELALALESMESSYSIELQNEIRECLEFARHHRETLGL